ncbi:H-NS family histone-like protein [Endozoicomonadaceae bacterium StTr2]
MNIFEEITHRLSSKTRIRSLFKDVHAEDLERMIARMSDVLEEKKAVSAEEEARRKEKQESIEKIKELMASQGVSMDDLGTLAEATAKRKKRNIQKYTFEYQTEDGQTHSWEGATTGRLPRDFQEYLNRTGKKRIECAVTEIEE